jgi:hypothetical protein
MSLHFHVAVDREAFPCGDCRGWWIVKLALSLTSCHVVSMSIAVNHEAFPYGDCRGWWIVKLHF